MVGARSTKRIDMSEETSPGQQPPELKKSGNSGCLWTVVISVVVGIALIVGGGYYVMMHTSLPFQPLIKMINASGDAQIKGFKGSLASGFALDEFRIFSTGKSDTSFEGVSFKYNGAKDPSGKGHFIIEEFAIRKAFISLPPLEENEKEEVKVTPAFHEPELDAALNQEQLDEVGVLEIKSIRIDEFIIENAEGEQKKGSFLLSNFKADASGVTLGDLQATGDFLEMKLDAAPEGSPYRQIVRGVVKAALDKAILKDIPFTVEFGGAQRARFAVFDGKLSATPEGEDSVRTVIKGLTLSDYLSPTVVSMPTDLNLTMITTDKGRRTEVEGGDFRLGKTRFKVDVQALIDGDDPEANKLTATAEIDGKEVVLRIAEPDERHRHFTYEFSCEGIEADELPARVLFHKPVSQLSDAEKQQLEQFVSRHIRQPESAPASAEAGQASTPAPEPAAPEPAAPTAGSAPEKRP